MNMGAEPNQISPGLWLLAAALVLVPAVLVPVIPRRWLARAILGWLFAPLGLMLTGFVLLMFVGAGSDSGGVDNALLAVGYIGIFVLVPWFVVALLGIGLGLLARTVVRRRTSEAPPETEDQPKLPSAAPPTNAPPAPATPAHKPAPAITLPPFTGMTTEQLHQRIREIARDFGIEERRLRMIGDPENGAPYAYVDHQGLQLGYFERGDMFDNGTTRDLDEMLYWIFDHVTYDMANEAARLSETHDDQIGPRLIERQGELLAKLNPEWHARWLNDPFCRASHYRREAHP